MLDASARRLLEPLLSSVGEKHAEFKRRRDQNIYQKVPIGGEGPYLAEGWSPSKKLKKQIRLAKEKSFDRQFEDRVWRLFYRMGYQDLNKAMPLPSATGRPTALAERSKSIYSQKMTKP